MKVLKLLVDNMLMGWFVQFKIFSRRNERIKRLFHNKVT